MKKKQERFDIPIEFTEEDLQELFESYDPEKLESKAFRERSPIVLAHGIARPDYFIDSMFRTLNLSIYDFSFVSDRFHYFKGIASHLKKYHFEVYHTSVSFAADVDTRAKDLKREIIKILEKTAYNKVHIIGHSMGGLDARHMIVKEDMAGHVATLTTIGTPHLGTSVADAAIERGIDKVIGILSNIINIKGIRSVTRKSCQEFNEYARDQEAKNEVIYQTYYSSQTLERTFFPFQIAWKIIHEEEGENDGLVSVKSQKWCDRLVASDGTIKKIRRVAFPIPADHVDQMGWWNLNEIHKSGWWNLKALAEKNRHEAIIREVYLKIARDVSTYV